MDIRRKSTIKIDRIKNASKFRHWMKTAMQSDDMNCQSISSFLSLFILLFVNNSNKPKIEPIIQKVFDDISLYSFK